MRFEDVDASGAVFFAHLLGYCHEAMEALFAPLDGGYARLILERKIGLPAVSILADFAAPLRYGDTAIVEVTASRVGVTSCVLDYAVTRGGDGARAATVRHVCVVSDLERLVKVPIPDDVRAVLEANAAPPAPG